MDGWILIPGWAKFQHYADRDPAWIKVYLELQRRDDWLHLSLAEKGLLVSIWIEYAARNGLVRSADIPSFVLQKVPRRSLDSLQEAGFIEVSASRPLALPRAGARSKEKEKEKDLPKKVSTDKPSELARVNAPRHGEGPARRWIDNGLAEQVPDGQLAEVLRDEFDIQDDAVLADLVNYANGRTP